MYGAIVATFLAVIVAIVGISKHQTQFVNRNRKIKQSKNSSPNSRIVNWGSILCMPPSFSALQLDEQFVNCIGVAALGDQFIAELQQSTDHQAVFCGGKGKNPFRCFHIDPSYVYLLRLYIGGILSANVQINMPGCRNPGSHNIRSGIFAGHRNRLYCPRWCRHNHPQPFGQCQHDRTDHPAARIRHRENPSQRR